MRYVAFFFLVLLSLYFLFLKPYLILKKVYYGVEGFSLGLSPPSVRVSSLYLYVPLEGRSLFLYLKDLSLVYEGKIRLSLKEGVFNSVRAEETPLSVPRLEVPELLKESQISVESFLINAVEGKKINTFLLRNITLKDRRLRGEGEVLTGGLAFHILLGNALLRERDILVGRARLWSDLFYLEVKGSLREGQVTAGFSLKGRVERIERGQVVVEPITLEGDGVLDYEKLKVSLRGTTKEAQVKGKLRLEDLRTDSELVVKLGGEAYLRGKVWNDLTSWDYELHLLPELLLEARTDRLLIDSDLLGIPYLLFVQVKGEVVYRIGEGKLELSLSGEDLSVEGLRFRSSTLDLSYDLREGVGAVSLRASDPGYLSLKGEIEGERFEGDLEISDLFLIHDQISTCLSYRGRVGYEGVLRTYGSGRFVDLSYGELNLGKGDYRFYLEGKRVALSYWGEGFSGRAEGSLDGVITARTELKGFRREISGVNLQVGRGGINFSSNGKGFSVEVEIVEGKFKREDLEGSFSGSLRLKKGDKLEGDYRIDLKNVRLGSKVVQTSDLKGVVKGDLSWGTYAAGEILKGSYTFKIEEKVLRTTGKLQLERLSGGFSFEGSPKEGRGEWWADVLYLDKPVRLRGAGSYKGESLSLRVNPAEYEGRIFKVTFGGLEILGSRGQGEIRFKGMWVSALGEPVVSLVQKEGSLSLKERPRAEWRGKLEGAIKGEVELSYSEGVLLTSKGSVNLDRLTFFTATPLGGKASGKLAYSVLYKDGKLNLEVKNEGSVTTFSRYLSLPMETWVDLRAAGESLAAFITLWKGDRGISANVGSINLKDYYIYFISRELPVLYRDEGLMLSIKASSEGWVDVKNMKEVNLRLDALLSGDVEVKKIEKKKEKGSKGVGIGLDVRFESEKPIRILLPEGYVYGNVRGWVSGTSTDPKYSVEVALVSGELRYFNRTFFVKEGVISSVKDEEGEGTKVDITLMNVSDDLRIFLRVRGGLEDPKLTVWSEPPRATGEILTKLVIGSTTEGLLPVAKALFEQLGYVGSVRGELANLLGVEISLSTQTGAQGEIGFGVNVKKKISRSLSVEYQQSTLKDPKETYYGGSLSLPAGLSLSGRVFSNRTSELKLRFLRKFDF